MQIKFLRDLRFTQWTKIAFYSLAERLHSAATREMYSGIECLKLGLYHCSLKGK
jgi:hypothetical protein